MNQDKLNAFLCRALGDMGASMSAVLTLIGDRLGLYRSMAGAGPMSSEDLATKTGTAERYVREWLRAQAAGGYVVYHPETDRYELPDEQATCLADENSPLFLHGYFQIVAAMFEDEPKLTRAFLTGKGVGWHDHAAGLFEGTERFFRPGYNANLVSAWIPALDGVQQRLEAGALVADVGCGHGASTIIMARAFPKSRFVGFDYHDASILRARQLAMRAGVEDRVTFRVARAQDFPGGPYDLVTVFDALHDMGDPVGAARHVCRSLQRDGTWMVVEPNAQDDVEGNLNPIGRIFYSASTLVCTPASLSQEVGMGLGAQAGEKRLTAVMREGGFSRVRKATETPFNMVLEARP